MLKAVLRGLCFLASATRVNVSVKSTLTDGEYYKSLLFALNKIHNKHLDFTHFSILAHKNSVVHELLYFRTEYPSLSYLMITYMTRQLPNKPTTNTTE